MACGQLPLLLHKELLVMWRCKIRTLLEVLLPLLISLPIIIVVIQNSSKTKVDERIFGSFKVSGTWEDIDRNVGMLSTIHRKYCSKPTLQIGIAFVDQDDVVYEETFIREFERRYSGNESSKEGVKNESSKEGVKLKSFKSEGALGDALNMDSSAGDWCASAFVCGIVVREFDVLGRRLRYTLRMHNPPGGDASWYTGDEQWVSGGPFEVLADINPVPFSANYWSYGFLSFQFAVDSIFTKMVNNVSDVAEGEDVVVTMERMPEPAHYEKTIMMFLKFLSVFWPVVVTPCIAHSATNVASEKETGMKAYLSVMGLSSLMYYCSHAIIGFVKIAAALIPGVLILLPTFVMVSPTLFLVTVLIYCAAVVSFALLISSVLHSASSVVKLSILLWIFLIFAGSKFFWSPTSRVALLFFSLNVNFALTEAVDAFRDYMNRDMYLGWLNCFDGFAYNSYPLGLALLMLVVDIVWMSLLTVYLDNVNPYGDLPRKHPLYFICLSAVDDEILKENEDGGGVGDVEDGNENVQPECGTVNSVEADIDVRHLTKIYGMHRAVDRLSFRAYRGNVTVLLGHNGAGKSTTFAVLTGLARASSGSVRICGIELNARNLGRCQRSIGFCPQYNPLFELLSVREHLQFFRSLKSNPDDCVDELLSDLHLVDKSTELAKNLSGGMKRKLCVGMSLVGGSRVVLLDEPTAGMDPGARRAVSDLIERCKQDRTILLTTHYMDEADVLGDRISIMVKGRLACAGTSEFLKSRFGTGYLLAVALKEKSSVPNRMDILLKTIRLYVENAEVQSASTRQITVLLPAEHKHRFSSLFERLEDGAERWGIDSFGLSLNTLEQVFLTVGERAEPQSTARDSSDSSRRQASQICDFSLKTRSGMWLCLWQIGALLWKRVLCTIRRWPRLIPQVFLPLLLLIAVAYLLNLRRESHSPEELPLNVGELSPSIVAVRPEPQPSAFAGNVNGIASSVPGYTVVTVPSDMSMRSLLLDMPKKLPAVSVGVVADGGNRTEGMPLAKAFFNGKARHGPVIALTLVANARLGNSSESIVVSLYPYGDAGGGGRSPMSSSEQTLAVAPLLILIFSLLSSGFVMFLVEERVYQFLHQQLLTGLTAAVYWISVILFDALLYTVTCCLFMIIFVISNWMSSFKLDIALVWLVYLWMSMPFVYSMSFLFSKATKAYVVLMCINLCASLCALFFSLILVFYAPQVQTIFQTICLLLLPTYALGNAVMMIARQAVAGDGHELYQWQNLGRILCMMAISGLIFWSLLIAIQSRRIARFAHSVWNVRCRRVATTGVPRFPVHALEEDRDIADERRRLNDGDEQLAVCVRDLNKYYGQLHAVKNLSFGVRQDECFGLLGVNGAGKTSTFDMITGVSIRDSGSVTLCGRSVDDGQAMGFCPQFDALLSCLTPRETLSLMASLRGFTDVSKRVDGVLNAVSLTSQADKRVGTLSGGQRRRLSMGVALIVRARVVLLDEPTAGIDPKARRHIWNLLSAVREHSCAMLLTSHSMDECEVLCTRIGIMHAGALTAIGSPQHIKSRYGERYSLTMTIRDVSKKEEVVAAMAVHFPLATLKTLHPSVHLVWHIPKTDTDRWSRLFGEVHNFAATHPAVVDYSIAQASLEEAFLRLSNPDDEQQASIIERNAPADVFALV